MDSKIKQEKNTVRGFPHVVFSRWDKSYKRYQNILSISDKERGGFLLNVPIHSDQKKKTSVSFHAFTIDLGKKLSDIKHLKDSLKIPLPNFQVGIVVNPDSVDLSLPLTKTCFTFKTIDKINMWDAPLEMLSKAFYHGPKSKAIYDQLFSQKTEILDAESQAQASITMPLSVGNKVGGEHLITISLEFDPVKQEKGKLQLDLGNGKSYLLQVPQHESPYYFIFYLTSLADNQDVIQLLQDV